MATNYEKDKDYQSLIDAAVASGDYMGAIQYAQQKGAQLQGESNVSTPKYDENTDYAAKAGTMFSSGDLGGAYEALFGSSNSREAKVAGIGNDYGTSSQSIWNNLVSQYGNRNTNIDLLKNQLATLTAQTNQQTPYQGGWADDAYKALLEKATNMNYQDWTDGDQYKSLSDRYSRKGNMAMQDVLGQVSSRTGGLASSYATTAAQQQYNDYMEQLEGAAQSVFDNERGDLIQNAGLAKDYGQQEYSRYMDQLNQTRQSQGTALNTVNALLGYAYKDNDAAKSDAQNRIHDYIVNQGGSVANLSADLITASGYTTAELNAMEAKYLQNIAGSGGYSGGGGGGRRSSGGSGGLDYEGLFQAAKANGNPQSFLSQKSQIKQYGFTSSNGLYADYQNWLASSNKPKGNGYVSTSPLRNTSATNSSPATKSAASTKTTPSAGNYQAVVSQINQMKAAGKSVAAQRAAINDAYSRGLITGSQYNALMYKK